MGFTSRESSPSRVRNCLIFALPQSTTNRTPETVTEVSAILVATLIFRVRGGAGKILAAERPGGKRRTEAEREPWEVPGPYPPHTR